MAGLVPAIHEFFCAAGTKNVDARNESGHDGVYGKLIERGRAAIRLSTNFNSGHTEQESEQRVVGLQAEGEAAVGDGVGIPGLGDVGRARVNVAEGAR